MKKSFSLKVSSLPIGVKPRPYQLRVVNKVVEQGACGVFHHMGRGKTLTATLAAAELYLRGKIDVAVVFAPNFIKMVWMREFSRYGDLVDVFVAKGGMTERDKIERFLSNADGLPVLVFSVESMSNKKFAEYVRQIVSKRAALSVVDESTSIKNPAAQRTKNIVKVGDSSQYKMILTGTPVTNGIEDIYSQVRFLGKNVWPYKNFYVFRANHCVMGGFEGRKIIGYKNVPEMMDIISPWVDIQEIDSSMFPERSWVTIEAELSPKQAQMVDKVWNEYTIPNEDGDITVTTALTALTYAQMMCGGVIPNGEGGGTMLDDKNNGKLAALKEQISLIPEGSKVIIWCRFREEHRAICDWLSDRFGSDLVCKFIGGMSLEEQKQSNDSFQNGPARFMVSTYAGARGQTWTAAEYAIFYSCDFSLEVREQAEARNWGRDNASHDVTYIDIIADHWVDRLVYKAIKKKEDIANLVKDELKKQKGIT